MRLVCSTLALCGGAVAAPLASQVPLAAAADGRAAPGGAVVATLRSGTRVAVGAQRGADVLVTLEGWVDASMLGAKRDSFAASVSGTSALRVRATPSLQGAILGELKPGAGVATLARKGTWARVRRGAWIPQGALPKSRTSGNGSDGSSASAAAAAPGAGDAARADVPAQAPAGAMSTTRATRLLAAPGGDSLGDLVSGAVVQPVARDRGWMRVSVEGWVNERDLVPADSSFGAGLSAADLRANPAGTRGKVVRWEVQILSLQAADPLRRDMARDEPYFLAKGPAGENALLYLTIPPSLLGEARAIQPLTNVTITARVRNGHSEPVGTPILDLKSIVRR